jgi:hypothetical protein
MREQAKIERWNRRMELELFTPIGRTAQNANPLFQNRFRQFPEYGETQRAVVYQRLERMDQELDGLSSLPPTALQSPTITALVAIDFGGHLAHISLQSWLI